MDCLDHAILEQLVADCRITNAELADRVGLSPSACLRRVRSLERSGAVVGYHARLNPALINRGFQVVVAIEMSTQEHGTLEAFEKAVASVDEIARAHRMFGQPDYLLWVAVADRDAYEVLYMDTLTALPGISRAISQFTMKTIKGQPQKWRGTRPR